MDEENIKSEKHPDEHQDDLPEEGESLDRRAGKRRRLIIAGSVVTVVGIAVLALLLWRFSGDSEAGRPVPAPRTTSVGEPETVGQTAEQTITIAPEQVERAGIKIETVGEQMSAEGGTALTTGVVQANAYRETPVIAVAGGIVRQMNAELGERVNRGETLAIVSSDELAQAQSRYVALLTEVANARRNYDRAERLVRINQPGRTEFDQATKQLKASEAELDEHHRHHLRTQKLVAIGAASREELEQATTKLRTAEAEVTEARARLDRARQLLDINPQTRSEAEEAANKLRNAEGELASTREKLLIYGMSLGRVAALRSTSQINAEITVAAPVSGTVTGRAVNRGEVVETNKELMRVTDLSSVWVIAQVYENDLARIRTGSGATVTSNSYPDRVFRGHVTYIDPNINQETRTAQARIEVDNPGEVLKIGMYVNVAFGSLGQAERTMPTVPAAAVQAIGDRQIVFLATDQPNVFVLRPVRLGPETGGRHPVLEGLTVGDRIVSEGSFVLRAEWLKLHPDES